MEQVKKRGVIVYITEQGESHRRVGLYTEEGMLYFTLYGARSAKGHTKSILSMFTMGTFLFVLGSRNVYKYVDVQVFDSAMALSNTLEFYYSACVGAEIVRLMVGADHELQFKVLVDFLLWLINPAHQEWRSALMLFLWRSLVYNGWQPKIPQKTNFPNAHSQYVRYVDPDGFVDATDMSFLSISELSPSLIQYDLISILEQCKNTNFSKSCELIRKFESNKLQSLIEVLFAIWHNILGRKLHSAQFVIQ